MIYSCEEEKWNLSFQCIIAIENDLKNKIVLGHYKPGDILPSERELIEIYKVSRLTAREAVKRLEIQGAGKENTG